MASFKDLGAAFGLRQDDDRLLHGDVCLRIRRKARGKRGKIVRIFDGFAICIGRLPAASFA
jgi:hypothetical protein